jgi:hypothetical protein
MGAMGVDGVSGVANVNVGAGLGIGAATGEGGRPGMAEKTSIVGRACGSTSGSFAVRWRWIASRSIARRVPLSVRSIVSMSPRENFDVRDGSRSSRGVSRFAVSASCSEKLPDAFFIRPRS